MYSSLCGLRNTREAPGAVGKRDDESSANGRGILQEDHSPHGR